MRMRFAHAVVHGRFQPFHNEHLAYVKWAMDWAEHLVVGITSFDRDAVQTEPLSGHRHMPAANPFRYWERAVMIRDALLEAGIAPTQFSIVGLPVHAPERWPEYVPTDPGSSVHLLRVFSAWEEEKARRMRAAGYRVDVEAGRPKRLSATEVRARMAAADGWELTVPPAVARWIRVFDGVRRLQGLMEPEGEVRSR